MVMQKLSGIYKIYSRSKPERVYIGSAINIQKRWVEHSSALSNNRHGNSKLQHHYNKYGKSDLIFSLIICCDKEDLITTEQFFIDSYNPYFNICRIAGNCMGKKCLELTKQKIREKNKNYHPTKETIEKIKYTKRGYVLIEKIKRKYGIVD